MTTQVTNLTTTDGLTVYDLDVYGSALTAVAGPAGYDPATIDTDELPDGFRWVTTEEWESLEGDGDTLGEIVAANSISEDADVEESVADITRLLIEQGPTFSGGTDELARSGAEDWHDHFGDDLAQITRWIKAGYWNAYTASCVCDAGHTSKDRPTHNGECAIYALCNDDVSIEDCDW